MHFSAQMGNPWLACDGVVNLIPKNLECGFLFSDREPSPRIAGGRVLRVHCLYSVFRSAFESSHSPVLTGANLVFCETAEGELSPVSQKGAKV